MKQAKGASRGPKPRLKRTKLDKLEEELVNLKQLLAGAKYWASQGEQEYSGAIPYYEEQIEKVTRKIQFYGGGN